MPIYNVRVPVAAFLHLEVGAENETEALTAASELTPNLNGVCVELIRVLKPIMNASEPDVVSYSTRFKVHHETLVTMSVKKPEEWEAQWKQEEKQKLGPLFLALLEEIREKVTEYKGYRGVNGEQSEPIVDSVKAGAFDCLYDDIEDVFQACKLPGLSQSLS